MHTLFTLEDVYGLTVSETAGEVCLKVNKDKGKEAYELLQMLYAWKEQADKLSAGEISKDDYDRWRYYYPKYDTTQFWAKVPSQEMDDAMVLSLIQIFPTARITRTPVSFSRITRLMRSIFFWIAVESGTALRAVSYTHLSLR